MAKQQGQVLNSLYKLAFNTAKKITKDLLIPTIGIGSSKYCDGQVLVIDDVLNLHSSNKKRKFIKNFTNIERDYKGCQNFY